MININKVSAEGDNIFIFQHIDSEGNKTEERKSLEEFLQPFVKSYKDQIEILKNTIEDKAKIEGYLDKDVLELSEKVNALELEKNILEDQVSHFLKELEGKDLSQATSLYKNAFEFFTHGDIDKALEILDEAKLEEEENRAIETIKQKAETRILKAQILRVNHQFEEAGSNYEKAVNLYDSWDNCLEAGYYFQFINDFAKATHYYQVCLQKETSNEEKATTLNNLAVLQTDQNKYREAECSYEEALSIRRELVKLNRQAYLSNIADTLNNLAVLHNKTNAFEKAEACYEEALLTRRELASLDRQTYLPDVGVTLNNLANLQKATNEFEKANASYKEALSIRRE